MDAEIKRKWLMALREDQYQQGYRSLRNSQNCFCCLGVLCDIIDPKGWSRDHEDSGWDFDRDNGSFPPRRILEAAGTEAEQIGEHPFWTLAKMNDDRASFCQIANYIEAKF